MRNEAKIIYAAIEETKEPAQDVISPNIGIPIAQQIEPPRPLTYRELTKGAREIIALRASNLNTLFRQQNSTFPPIDDAKFVEFTFGSQCLLARFKATIIENGERIESSVMASWDGKSLKVF
jgi:hypothetical protein